MKDRIIGLMGSMGIILVLLAVPPISPANASPFWPNGPDTDCDGNCAGDFDNASNCKPTLLDPCTGPGCGCPYVGPPPGESVGSCPCTNGIEFSRHAIDQTF